jgi:glycosyltransferase involved in cell wall biosynthesis
MHHFLFDGPPQSPHETLHYGEFLEIANSSGELVHSTKWPVLGARSWVVDSDDVALPIICGRAVLSSEVRAIFAAPLQANVLRQIQVRATLMLRAYLHPSCAALLVWGNARTAICSARAWMARLELVSEFEALLRKIIVVRPAAHVEEDTVSKWSACRRFHIVFCGRDFETKNGELALNVLERIIGAFPDVRVTYIGRVPTDVRSKRAPLFSRITHLSDVSREGVRRVMKSAHVLFHPSMYESIGLVFLEAAGSGAAVVTARGSGMDYVDEFFADGGALLVDRDRIPAFLEEMEFEAQLRRLLCDRALARRLGMENYAKLARGAFSLQTLIDSLESVYERAASSLADPLSINDIAGCARWHHSTMSSLELRKEEIAASRNQVQRFVI